MISCFLSRVSFLICVIDIMLIQGTFISTFISQIYIQFSVAATFFSEKCRSLRMLFLNVLYYWIDSQWFLQDALKYLDSCLKVFYNVIVMSFIVFLLLIPIVFRLYIKKLLHSRLLSWEINWSGALHRPNEHYKNKDDIIR